MTDMFKWYYNFLSISPTFRSSHHPISFKFHQLIKSQYDIFNYKTYQSSNQPTVGKIYNDQHYWWEYLAFLLHPRSLEQTLALTPNWTNQDGDIQLGCFLIIMLKGIYSYSKSERTTARFKLRRTSTKKTKKTIIVMLNKKIQRKSKKRGQKGRTTTTILKN